MSQFEAFFAQNKIKSDDVNVVVSTCFIDKETGNPIPWTLRQLDESVNQKLKASSMKKVSSNGRTTRAELDSDTYICKLAVATVASPDLNNKELQDSWGVMDAEGLLRKMLSAGEYANLMIEVQKVNGFDIELGELVEEAKN